ncbi:hypothetical protein BO71DRAFT_382203 [Aspergillus ellipticus CBS 707.79]|uniref:CorA-like transporter domain-containing protein n=1 Tax=Aspergillus ellipticus CBS 707.79 TaxID=1448320 RepID=A0A319D7G8_9EURO|nr:hypothetical protein BO71DRAFT_382203 [Aspergillus ellipticus CBS 707.79]
MQIEMSSLSYGHENSLDEEHYASVLSCLRYLPLISEPEKCDIQLLDVVSTSVIKENKHTFTHSEAFESHVSESPKTDTRIISICSRNSISPLQITKQALLKVMSLYGIDNSFFDMVYSFGDKPRISDAGLGEMKMKQRADGSYDMQYLLVYADGYKAQGSIKWTVRQIGVFHRYYPSGKGDIWIFLHAKPGSKVQRQLEARIAQYLETLYNYWFSLHSLVLSSYLANWRWRIRGLGEELEKSADIALTRDLSRSEDVDQNVLFELLKPQHLGDVLLPLSSWMGVTLATTDKMKETNDLFYSKGLLAESDYQRILDELASHKANLEGHIRSIGVLERKAQGISDLLAVALSQKNQAVTISINQSMLDLTNEGFDENATVKVVTLVTLIYLPASFVSTVLGMNMFDFADGGKFLISPQFWIFVVLAVPLTLLTLAMWYLVTKRKLKHRERKKVKVKAQGEESV